MILTTSYINRISHEREIRYSETKAIIENRALFSEKQKYDIFLSHSILDNVQVLTLLHLFNKAGYSVYIDWIIDPQLDRTKVSKDTANVLRNRMSSSKGLAYVATSNSSQSKWCPWELGFVDGKINGRCAILPVLETETNTFIGQEYLGLYPYLQYAQVSGTDKYDFWVYENQKYVILSSWLFGYEPINH